MPAAAVALRRLTLLVGAAVLLDTSFLAVLAPLLPGLSHTLHLSKLGSGILTASYPAGMLVASYPAGIFAIRVGPRVAVAVGLGLLTVSTVAFALLHSAPELDLARFIEGIGGACSWDAGVAWLVALAPPARRGAVIGQVMSAATVGAVAGPGIGALASLTGRPALFITLAALSLGLAAIIFGLELPAGNPAPASISASRPPGPVHPVRCMVANRLGLLALWLMCVPAMVSGTLVVLGSLRLHALGAGAGVIGATFIVAAGGETAVSTWIGGISDRHGRLLPLTGSLLVAGAAIACFSAAPTAAVLVVVVGLAAMATGASWTPSMALLSDLAEAAGLDQALGAGLMNMAWAAGQIIGSGGSGALARLTSDTVATLLVAGLCLVTGVALLRGQTRLAPPVPGEGTPSA